MRTLWVTAATLFGLAILVAGGTALAGSQSSLSEVRGATAAYHDVQAAIEDGYTFELPDVYGKTCIANLTDPAAGAMGVHMVNPALLDGTIEPTRPEALVYERKADGRLKLAAVEYVIFKAPGLARPELFGVPFDSNDGSRFPATTGSPFWALHAWIWRPNHTDVTGIFSPWNPKVSC